MAPANGTARASEAELKLSWRFCEGSLTIRMPPVLGVWLVGCKGSCGDIEIAYVQVKLLGSGLVEAHTADGSDASFAHCSS